MQWIVLIVAAVVVLGLLIYFLPMVLVFSLGAIVGFVVVWLFFKLVFGILGMFKDRG